jgi:hyperosmotically inducible protein
MRLAGPLTKLGGLAAVILALAAATAFAQARTPLTPDQIKMMVERKLADEEALRNVKVSVEGGVVTLDGTVPSVWAKEKAVEEALEVSDVEKVVSNLTIASAENDDIIGREVAARVRNYVFYSIFDYVDIRVNNGVVTLTGYVVQPYRSREIERMTARVSGVKEVANQIEVLPASINDDQLRAHIASQIYGHSLFHKYAIQANPPVHIIVNRGHVILTGVVNSEVENRIAEHIARQTFGVFSVENRLRVEGRSRSR